MNTRDKLELVSSSLESFQALRKGLETLRSIGVIFETRDATKLVDRITGEARASGAELAETELAELAAYYIKAALCAHVGLLYAALCHYIRLVEINPELRHEELDHALRAARESGLFESMRELRNTVFHIRPSAQSERLVEKVLKQSRIDKLPGERLERLLYDATEKVFQSPEALFQEKEEVLMQGYRDALAYYEKHVAGAQTQK